MGEFVFIYLPVLVFAALVGFVLVRMFFETREHLREYGKRQGVLLALLTPFGQFIEQSALRDPQLAHKLDAYRKYVQQSGGTFLDGASPAEILAARYVFPVIALALVTPLLTLVGFPTFLAFVCALGFGFILYFWPEQGLQEAARIRTDQFSRMLPETLDVIRLVAQSGGDLYASIQDAIAVCPPSPVREELSRLVGEVAIGTSLGTALNNVALRIDTNDANAVFTTLAQSLEMGTSVADNLAQASELMRKSARTRAQMKAQRAVVNMTFPLLLLILPGTFVIIFAPMVIQYYSH